MKIPIFSKWWRVLYLLIISVVLQSFSTAQNTSLNDPPYKGYRLHLTDMKVVKKKDQQIKINYTLINTGREVVQLGKNKHNPASLLILFDHSLASENLIAYQEEIKEQLLRQNLSIAAGQINNQQEMVFSPREILTARGGTVKEVEEKVEVDIVEEEKPSPSEEVIEDKPTEVKVEKKEEDDYIPYLDKDNCADLAIDQIQVVKKSKNSVTLSFVITNYGTGTAELFGASDKKEDNVAIRANISGSKKLSRGAIVIGGDYIKGKRKSKNAILAPYESYQGTIKLDIRKMTRFTPNIILELDAYNALIECDETNNINVIEVK